MKNLGVGPRKWTILSWLLENIERFLCTIYSGEGVLECGSFFLKVKLSNVLFVFNFFFLAFRI